MSTDILWQAAYESAVQEMDNCRLAEKVHQAEEAIFTRLRTMPTAEQQERLAIQKALIALDILRRERLSNQRK